MHNYIDAVCEGLPLDKPSFNEDSEQWELYFEESHTPWHPYDQRDLIAVSFDSAEEAEQSYNYYSQSNEG